MVAMGTKAKETAVAADFSASFFYFYILIMFQWTKKLMGNKYTHVSTQEPGDVLTSVKKHRCSPSSCTLCQIKKLPVSHTDSINALAVVRAGMVITGGRDKLMCLQNVDSGELVQKWFGHEGEVTTITIKQVETMWCSVVVETQISTLGLSNLSEDPVDILKGHSMVVTGLCYIGDGKLLSGSRDVTTKQWDVNTKKVIRSVNVNRNLVTHMKFNPHMGLTAQTSEDKELKLWDHRTMAIAQKFPKKNNIQLHCDWTSDGLQIITCNNGFNGTGSEISVWDLRSGKLMRDMKGHDASVTCVSYFSQQELHNKRLVISCSRDKTARIWNIEDGSCLWVEDMSTGGELLQCSAVGHQYAVITGSDGFMANMRIKYMAGKPFFQFHAVRRIEY